jgi:hypothetical protein
MSDHLVSGRTAGRGDVSGSPRTRRHSPGTSGGTLAGALLGPGTLAADPVPATMPAQPGAPPQGTLLVFTLNLARVDFAGALHDPVAAAVFGAPQKADYTAIDGRVIVRDGHLTTIDLPGVIEQQNRIARALAGP